MSFFELFWDLRQEQRIGDAEDAAQRTTRSVQSTRSEIELLRGQLERAALVQQALWELVRDRAGITEEELEAKVQEIDVRDGKQDGRIGGVVSPCPNCKRPNAAWRANCLYCSTALRPSP